MTKTRDRGFRIALVFLAAVIVVTALALLIGNRYFHSDVPFDGLGTVDSPYLISSAEDLCRLRDKVNAGMRFDGQHFLQSADLDLSAIDHFTPIGTATAGFGGVYNGGGHVITHLTITEGEPVRDAESGIAAPTALFARLGGTVMNLGVRDSAVTGTRAAGLVGQTESASAALINCYSLANVQGREVAGGLALSIEGKVVACFFGGSCEAPVCDPIAPEGVGVLLGSSAARIDCVTEQALGNRALPMTEQEIAALCADFSAHVQLYVFPATQLYASLLRGKGTRKEPFLIRDLHELCLMREMVNAGYSFDGYWVRQETDLDLGAIENWLPIGVPGTNSYFWGTYDGGGHTVSNLHIRAEGARAGFFGVLCGRVLNLGIESGRIEGSYVGSIAAQSGSDRSMILNCYSKAELIATERAGGIAGHMIGGTVANCYFAGTLSGEGKGILAESASFAVNNVAVGYDALGTYTGLVKGDNVRVETLRDAVKQANRTQLHSVRTLSVGAYTLYRFGDAGAFDGARAFAPLVLLQQIGIALLLVILAVAVALLAYHLYYQKRFDLAQCRAALRERFCTPFRARETRLRAVVCGIFAACSLLVLAAVVSGDTALANAYVHSAGEDVLMDIFNPMRVLLNTDYDRTGHYTHLDNTYPPVARTVLLLLGHFLTFDAAKQSAAATRASGYGILLVFLLVGLCFLAFYRLWRRQLGEGIGARWLPVLLLLTPAMMYTVERGNLIILTFLFSLLFLAGYRSENVLVRNLAYACLGLATALKIYPVVLGLLAVRERNKRYITECLAWGVLCVFLPFAFFGGYVSILYYVRNVTASFAKFSFGYDGGIINYSNTWLFLGEYVLGDVLLGKRIAELTLYPLTLLLVACALLARERWRALLALTLILVLFPGFSIYYMAIFFIAPLLALLTAPRTGRTDWVYGIGLSFMLAPLTFLCGAAGVTASGPKMLTALLAVVLALFLIVETAWRILRERPWQKNTQSADAPCV